MATSSGGTPSRRSPYDRLRHDLEHNQQVARDIALGKRIGFYRLKSQLGTGNFSKVKLGQHLLTTERVAVKIMDKTKLDDNARKLLSREISCMECLNHPNIIRLFEIIESFSHLHIVMECASEGDLHNKVAKNGPMCEEEGRQIFSQVVAAIDHMHNANIIHRDLKAENVFFVSSTHIKVGDFGFSTHNTDSHLDTFCGSPPYAAPELFAEESYCGPLVDMWAMGVLLFYTLSGNLPFRGDTIPQLKNSILTNDCHIPPKLSPACHELIAGLLKKAPEERFTMEDALNSWWLTGSAASTPATQHGAVSSYRGSIHSRDNIDDEILQALEKLGMPTSDMDQIVGEPRNSIAGTYRILLHRKHCSVLDCAATGDSGATAGSPTSAGPSDRRRDSNGATVTGRKSSAKKGRKKQKSRFCVIS